MVLGFDFKYLDFQFNGFFIDVIWYQQFLQLSVFDQFLKRGWDQEVRCELQEEYFSFNEIIILFDDLYLEDYFN